MNQNKPLGGVKCVVESCVHHSSANECLASSITVGGHNASAAKETGCETFCKKGHCN